MKHNFSKWMWGLCCLLACALAACSNEEDFASQGNTSVPREDGLYLSFLINGETPPTVETRVVGEIPGEDVLNENLVKTVDVFVFKADGTLNQNGYVHADLTDSQQAVSVYKGTGWIDNFTQGETYTAYVVANYKGSATLASVQSLDNLKAVVTEDADVVKWKGMAGYAGEDKTFVMDGKLSFTRAELGDGSKEKELTVDLRRAAVKVELTIKPSADFKDKFKATAFDVRVANYATCSAAIAEGNKLDADRRGFAAYPVADATYNSDLVVSRKPDEQSVARFYTYVNRWDDLVQNETMLLIDLPGYYEDKPYAHNYYKVPIISSQLPQVLERNAFYQITATVDMMGNEELDKPVTLTNVEFKVADWREESVTVGDDTQPTYLVLSNYYIDIRNADGFDNLEFYSSSPIKSIDFVSGNEAINPANEGHLEFDYPGEGSTIPSIYFVNKDNERTEVDVETEGSRWDPNPMYGAVEITHDPGTQGNIHIKSLNPTNVTKRYITFKVTNEDGISKYVIVEQYPLEYIQPIAGYYSYRDDLKATGGTYEEHGTGSGLSSTTIYNGGTAFFASKIKVGNNIKGWYWDRERSWGNYTWSVKTANASSYGYTSFPNNNMMYFVTITQTSEDYKIAHPLTEKDTSLGNQLVTVDTPENDEFVSPTFMLASQLGTVMTPDDWEMARRHCAYYVETYKGKDGKTVVLDDWRLPTTAEINVIIKYQKNPNADDVMDEVLSGSYYYVGNSQARNGSGTAFVSTGNGGTAVRCIRDVKPDDEFMKQ